MGGERLSAKTLAKLVNDATDDDSQVLDELEKAVEGYSRDGLRRELKKARSVTNADAEEMAEDLLKKLNATSLGDWLVLHRLQRATVSEVTQLGPFTVGRWPEDATTLGATGLVGQPSDGTVVVVKVRAREADYAERRARQEFACLDDVLRFLLRSWEGSDPSNYGVNPSGPDAHFIIGPNTRGRTRTLGLGQGALKQIDIDDVTKSPVAQWLWEAVGAPDRTFMQKQVVAAVRWVGMAQVDPNPARALVQAVTALEVLLVKDQKKKEVSEGVAWLLGTDVNSRNEWEQSAKKLYEMRCEIVHDGKSDVRWIDAKEAIEMARSLIEAVASNAELAELKSKGALKQLVSDRKKASSNDG